MSFHMKMAEITTAVLKRCYNDGNFSSLCSIRNMQEGDVEKKEKVEIMYGYVFLCLQYMEEKGGARDTDVVNAEHSLAVQDQKILTSIRTQQMQSTEKDKYSLHFLKFYFRNKIFLCALS